MQTQRPNWVQVVTFLLVAVMILGFIYSYTIKEEPVQPATAEEIAALIPAVTVPTAEEIASQIDLPTLKNDNLDDILEGVYPEMVDDLVRDCARDLRDEYMDDVEDEMEDLIQAHTEEEVKDVSIVDYNWDDEFDYTVINLGLNDEDDRAIEFYSILRVKYHEEFGDDDWHFEKVEVIATCDDWDSEDNEFDDLNVGYQIA